LKNKKWFSFQNQGIIFIFSVFRMKKREKTIKAVEKSFFSRYFFEKVCARIKKGNNFMTQEYYPLE